MSDAASVPEVAAKLTNQELVTEAVRFTKTFQRMLTSSPSSSLSYDHARVLETLICNGPQRMRDIADQFDLPARNLTTVADALEADHLIRRTPHPTDRRATLLELTDAGRSTIEDTLAPRLLEIDALFDGLSTTDKTRLTKAFRRLVVNMEHATSPHD